MAFPSTIPPRRDVAWTAELLQTPIPVLDLHGWKALRIYASRRYNNAGPSDSDTCLEVLHAANFVTQHPADLHR